MTTFFEESRNMPDLILPVPYGRGRKHREPIGLKISLKETGRKGLKVTIDTEEGQVDPTEIFSWLVGRNAFTVCAGRGEIDSLFRILNREQLMELIQFSETHHNGVTIKIYGNEGTMSVRRGNQWGRLNNVIRLCEGIELDGSPESFRKAVQLANLKIQHHGFRDVALRSVGQTIQDMVMNSPSLVRKETRQILPSPYHTNRFLQSFKAGRMEGVVFGRSENCFDYDIKAAYPSIISKLISTVDMQWVDTTDVVENAFYGAARCDIYINESIIRGPIGVRYSRSTFYPVGLLPGVWLNKPEIDLLIENPYLGRIIKIHEASWGVPSKDSYPFRRLMYKLYNIRQSDKFLAGFLKYAMAALWGKFISCYPVRSISGETYTQSSFLYSPIFAAHVTAQMRCELFMKSLSKNVVGEFVDGLTTLEEMVQTGGFGGFEEQGRGALVLFNDQYKGSEWKNDRLIDIAEGNPDSKCLEWPNEQLLSLDHAYLRFGPSTFEHHIGRKAEFIRRIPLGSRTRTLAPQLTGELRVGHLLQDSFLTSPLKYTQVRALRFTDKEEMIWPDAI